MCLICIDVSLYKYRIGSAKRYHAFPLIVDGLHQCFFVSTFHFRQSEASPLHLLADWP